MARFKLDEIDHKILDMLIENTRMPFTDIAKALDISAGTVHIRVRKMEESGIIKSSTLTVDYEKIGYTFVAYVGIFLEKNHQTQFVIERLTEIPYITQASIISGKYNILCKIRAKDTKHAKEIIFQIDDIEGVYRTESMISMEESISDKKRLLHTVFKRIIKLINMNILYFLPLYNHTNGTMMILLFALVCLMLTYAVASIINKNQKKKNR